MRINETTNDTLMTMVEMFKAAGDPVRLRLMALIGADEVCVCHLHEALNLPQSTVSRHLAYLRQRGLVVGRKEGLWVYYRLAKPVGEAHWGLLKTLAGCGQESETLRLDRDRLRSRACCDE